MSNKSRMYEGTFVGSQIKALAAGTALNVDLHLGQEGCSAGKVASRIPQFPPQLRYYRSLPKLS
jgi:hypothetical protein